jgi:hypothetical protein
MLYDWTNEEVFVNPENVHLLEEYMVNALLLNPETETPTFEEETCSVICNNFKFGVPHRLVKLVMMPQ